MLTETLWKGPGKLTGATGQVTGVGAAALATGRGGRPSSPVWLRVAEGRGAVGGQGGGGAG